MRNVFRALVPVLLLSAWTAGRPPSAGTAPEGSGAIETAADLIEAMRARYDGQWYRTLTFIQLSVQHGAAGGRDTTYWHEALEMPGKLRIDFEPLDAGNGMLFRDGTLYRIQNGKVTGSQKQEHALMLLGFDVYFLPPEETLARLGRMGFDLSKMHESTWRGRPVYVVGSETDDERRSQFWIDGERLYFVRVVQPLPDGSLRETQFNRYRPLGGGWVAPEVLFFVNGNVVFEEYYHDVRAGVSLDPMVFDPEHWREGLRRGN
jgi:hypothetical protein